ncbi:hypothetical protein [Paludibaculum fermentans]|uniref:Uncharacterized protein n=1 Tax=Paludibaculum fermentans TaxID=1473598 RepID=A0A7S7NMR8_PALFE|nr:hypothetical protein [Paludibaculum fermentans]QOY86461.1 hypothetical protein IRI77_27190 [Paludibaculum fermentans]
MDSDVHYPISRNLWMGLGEYPLQPIQGAGSGGARFVRLAMISLTPRR